MNTSDATAAAREVRRRWRAGEAPDGDVIVYADGSLSVMDLTCFSSPHGLEDPRAERWEWVELLRATAWTAGDWVDVDCVLATCAYAGGRALAGESAAHGSIGWVALTRDDDPGAFAWVAVSGGSNPFAEVTLDETTVTAVSTTGHVWAFPRNAPHQVRITTAPDH
ncbi:hypothetical protein GCM10010149_38400 [Nonomuraea roseoviolacea subsp. roseoviolacea]|uniref:hypothetical protein n=1 Tax=Nonomuraea roseoviolacea TaxID=103837 RepID=UPI0031E251D0